MTGFTVDVSHHDVDRLGSGLDWPKIAAQAIASCAKLTEGDPGGYWYTDPKGISNWRGADLAGMLSGGYHVLSRGDQAGINRQVDYFRKQLDTASGGGGYQRWAMVDVEPFPELVSRGITPRWVDCQRFQTRWAQLEDYPLAWYIPKWVWSGTLGSPGMAELPGPLVSSDYGANSAMPPAGLYTSRGGDNGRGWDAYGGKTPELWQYGSAAKVTGASSTTDINAYRGTPAQLTRRLTGATTQEDNDMTPEQAFQLEQIYNAMFFGGNSCGAPSTEGKANTKSAGNAVFDQLQELRRVLTAVNTSTRLDPAAIAAAVLQGLTPAEIAAAVVASLPPELAKDNAVALISELRTRLG